MLSVMEQETIVEEYVNKYVPQKEIAQRHRVTVQLVRDLVSESRKKPEKLTLAKKKELELEDKRTAIKEAVDNARAQGLAIDTADIIKTKVYE